MRARSVGPAILVVVLMTSACKHAAAPAPPVSRAEAVSHSQTAGYTLHIVFHGLIAYARDSGRLWAFLVNANYDPQNLKADDLPPDMFNELQQVPPSARDAWLHNRVPPHRPQIRFRNAKVTGSFTGNPTMGREVAGADLRFGTSGPHALGNVRLGQVANASLIVGARGELASQQADLAKLDQFDPLLVPPAPGLDKRLAARALIEAGDIAANVVNTCGRTLYAFKAPSEVGCPGAARQLAEEVVVEQTNLSGQVTIDLGTGEKIFVEPSDVTQPLVIEVANQTDEQIARAGAVDCGESTQHAEAFRWFYRLLNASGQASVSRHYFPCVANGTFGPPICPNKLMTVLN